MELTEEQLAAKAASEAEAAKLAATPQRFIVLRPILHGKDEFTAGDVVLMTPRQAAHLIASKALGIELATKSTVEPVDLSKPAPSEIQPPRNRQNK